MKGLKAYRLDVPPMLADRGIDRMLAFAVPLTVRFRGIKVREGTLRHGPEAVSFTPLTLPTNLLV